MLTREFTAGIGDFTIDQSNPQWHNYILCGFRGIVEAECVSTPAGMNLLVDGTVPPSAGLSSSSALVCCGSLVTMHANGLEIPKVGPLAAPFVDCISLSQGARHEAFTWCLFLHLPQFVVS